MKSLQQHHWGVGERKKISLMKPAGLEVESSTNERRGRRRWTNGNQDRARRERQAGIVASQSPKSEQIKRPPQIKHSIWCGMRNGT